MNLSKKLKRYLRTAGLVAALLTTSHTTKAQEEQEEGWLSSRIGTYANVFDKESAMLLDVEEFRIKLSPSFDINTEGIVTSTGSTNGLRIKGNSLWARPQLNYNFNENSRIFIGSEIEIDTFRLYYDTTPSYFPELGASYKFGTEKTKFTPTISLVRTKGLHLEGIISHQAGIIKPFAKVDYYPITNELFGSAGIKINAGPNNNPDKIELILKGYISREGVSIFFGGGGRF